MDDCITDRIECFVKSTGGPIKKRKKAVRDRSLEDGCELRQLSVLRCNREQTGLMDRSTNEQWNTNSNKRKTKEAVEDSWGKVVENPRKVRHRSQVPPGHPGPHRGGLCNVHGPRDGDPQSSHGPGHSLAAETSRKQIWSHTMVGY